MFRIFFILSLSFFSFSIYAQENCSFNEKDSQIVVNEQWGFYSKIPKDWANYPFMQEKQTCFYNELGSACGISSSNLNLTYDKRMQLNTEMLMYGLPSSGVVGEYENMIKKTYENSDVLIATYKPFQNTQLMYAVRVFKEDNKILFFCYSVEGLLSKYDKITLEELIDNTFLISENK
ncbi:MAG: hypothetical protein JXA94_02415 [Parachlamydiales bacterium]|nr:hypothetical protein [Parachlamydiales bacterium]